MLLIILLLMVRASSGGEECPPWFTLDISNNSVFPQCLCSEAADSIVTCNQRERTSYIKIGHCAYQDHNSNDTVVVASIPYVFPVHLIHNGFIRLPNNITDINTFTCGNLQRDTGTLLCGKCINGTGPSVYSFGSQCARCSRVNILYYLLLQYVPTTIIFVTILLFRYSIVSPPMSHYILYCNIAQLALKAPIGQYARFASTNILFISKLLLTLNYLLSLDPLYFISPPLCISDKLQEIYIPVLDMIAALYPFTLLLLTYILIELHARDFKPIVVMWKFSKCSKILSSWSSGSLIQIFAALFFLSFIKFISVLVDLTLTSHVISMQNKVVARVFYIDPTISIFNHRHLAIIILFTIVFILFLLPLVFLLMLYPTVCFRRITTCFKPRWLLTIKIFTDTFYGSFKDGTNGTRDYRPIAGITFIIWIMIPVLIAVCGTVNVSWPLFVLPVLIVVIVFLSVLKPYKHKEHNVTGTLLAVLLLVVGGISGVVDTYTYSSRMLLLTMALLTLPHCLICGYVIYTLIKKIKQCTTTANNGEEYRPLVLQ